MVRHISNKDAYMNFWRRTADFSGRSSRKEYWLPMIINLICFFALLYLAQYIDTTLGIDLKSKLSFNYFIEKIVGLIMSIGVLSVTVRRFHDMNLTGGFAVVPGILAMSIVLLSLVLNQFGVNTGFIMATLLPILLIIIAIIFILTLMRDGTHGPNDYGEDPLNR